MLLINDLTRVFGSVRAVEGVTLGVPEGSFVGIIGRSGAGKSTLLRMINRLIVPSSGSIKWRNEEISHLGGKALRQWRSRCAMIFQQFNLIPRMDVLDNVLVGALGRKPLPTGLLRHFTRDERLEALAALDRVEMADFALRPVSTLSGGQQQRVAIARAIMQRPEIILADEPIAALDPRSARRVMEFLRKMKQEDGLTVLVNLHHLDTAREFSDRIVGMASGRVQFDGSPDELTKAKVEELYGGGAAEQERLSVEAVSQS